MNENQELYGINLDDYASPKIVRGKNGYLGTKEDLQAFVNALGSKCYSEAAITNAIKAIHAWLNGDNLQELAKSIGPTFEKVHTLDVYHQFEDVTLDRKYWQYIACNDAVYPMYAEKVHLSVAIISYEGTFYSAWRGSIEGLCVCLQGNGWTKLSGVISGHPETITYDYEEDVYQMRLYTLGKSIQPEDISLVISGLEKNKEKGLTYLCRDIIAEGDLRMARVASRQHPGGK